MQNTVEVEGLRDLRKALKTANVGFADLKAAGLEAAQPVLEQSKTLVPVLSGALEQSLRAAGQARGAVVRAGFKSVPYAGVIHFGSPSRNIPARPYLYDALDRRQSEVVAIYEKRVNDIAKKI